MQQSGYPDCWLYRMSKRSILSVVLVLGLGLPAGSICASADTCASGGSIDVGCCCGPGTSSRPCCEQDDGPSLDPGCGCGRADHTVQSLAPARTDDPDRAPWGTTAPAGLMPHNALPDLSAPRRGLLPSSRGCGPPPLLASCVLRL